VKTECCYKNTIRLNHSEALPNTFDHNTYTSFIARRHLCTGQTCLYTFVYYKRIDMTAHGPVIYPIINRVGELIIRRWSIIGSCRQICIILGVRFPSYLSKKRNKPYQEILFISLKDFSSNIPVAICGIKWTSAKNVNKFYNTNHVRCVLCYWTNYIHM